MRQKAILIVESDRGLRRIFRRVFERRGWQVREAQNGSEALGALQSEAVNVVVTDFALPDMNGVDLCKHVRESSNVPIVLMAVEMEKVDIAARSMANAVLAMPFPMDTLFDVVSKLLGEGGS